MEGRSRYIAVVGLAVNELALYQGTALAGPHKAHSYEGFSP